MQLEIIAREPAELCHPTPLLFIHGAQHAAWCWEAHFLDYFAQHGFAAYALSLRGHGRSEGRDRLRWARIADYVDDVTSVTAQLARSPVLIGHSMGGFVIQKYLERHDAPGAVLLSSPPPSGMVRTMLRVARRRPWHVLRMTATHSLKSLIATPELAREAYFSPDVSPYALRTHWTLMQDESFMAFLDMVVLDLPRPVMVKTPLLVLGAEGDNMISRDEIEATARAYGTTAEIISGVAHDSMLEPRWELVARRILGWLTMIGDHGGPGHLPDHGGTASHVRA